MKKVLLLTLLITLSFAKSYKEFAREYGYETVYNIALAKAKKREEAYIDDRGNKLLSVVQKTGKKVLAKKKINTDIHKRFIPLIVNREEVVLPKRFATPIVPVTYIIDYKDDTKFTKIMGYKNKKDFAHLLKK